MERARNLRFGEFRLDAVRRRLERRGEPVPLTGKPMDLLLALIAGRDRVLTREELLAAVWPDLIVEEANLTQTISVLRKALGEGPGENRFIATLAGRGYRFVAPVETGELVRPEAGAPDRGATLAPVAPKRRRWLAWAGALAGAMLLVGIWLGLTSVRRPSAPPVRPGTIAVLPVQLGGFDQPADDRGVALADAVIGRLTELGLDVVPTRAVLEFADPRRDTPQQAGQALGVETVAAISVRPGAQGLEASVQLVHTVSGTTRHSIRIEQAGPLESSGEALAWAIAERIAAER